MKFLIYLICLITVYDIYLTVKQHNTIYHDEKNTIAKLLIENNNTPPDDRSYTDAITKSIDIEHNADISKLILFKMLGVIAAAHILKWILRFRIHKIVIPVVALGQLLLLIHLLR